MKLFKAQKKHQFHITFVLAAILAAVSVGCRTGHPFKTENLSKLQPGVTTEQEAKDLLGKPVRAMKSSDGSSILSFVDMVMYPGFGGGSGSYKSVTVFFDANGKFKNYTTSQSK